MQETHLNRNLKVICNDDVDVPSGSGFGDVVVQCSVGLGSRAIRNYCN